LTFETVSYQDPSQTDSSQFRALHAYFEQTFPLVHEHLSHETVNELSLLYTWEGSDPDLDPVLLMGHMDVVPVIPGTEHDWTHPPFAGVVAEGHIWGRGAIDDKSSVVSILEAVEALLANGFQPARTVYLAFGHDEEVGGRKGAKAIAEVLAERVQKEFAFVLDEGGAIADGLLPGVEGWVAVIGIAEKGFLSLELRAEADGGHSSMPPRNTAVGILSKAVARLEEDPFPARLDGATLDMFEYIGPEMSFVTKLVFANLWLFEPVVRRRLLEDPQSAAMVRTTTAATMFNAGVKDNVLPITASAVVNFRIIPGETVETVTARVREVVDDERVEVTAVGFTADPSPVSDPESAAFRLLASTLRQVAPEGEYVITPYLVVGGTDARYYASRSRNVFRFLPVLMGEGDMDRFHGTNERLSIESLALSVRYFYQLIRNADKL
jgi:carboxypeptidase PM20D1